MREQREGREEGRAVHCVLTGQNNQDGTGFDLRAGENSLESERNGVCYYSRPSLHRAKYKMVVHLEPLVWTVRTVL